MENITNIREEIDKIDEKLVDLLQQRMKLVLKISAIKKEQSLPTHQPTREKEIFEKIASQTNATSHDYVQNIFTGILAESRRLQQGGFDE